MGNHGVMIMMGNKGGIKRFPCDQAFSHILTLQKIKRGYDRGFKIINNMCSTVSVPVLQFATSSVTRGNSFKLLNQRLYHDIRKYSFLHRIFKYLEQFARFCC